MASVFGIIVVVAIITALEVPHLLRERAGKELWAFLGLLMLAAALGTAVALEVDMPNPLEALTFVYKPLGDIIFGILER